MQPVTFLLPEPLLRAADDLAQARDVSLGAVIRATLSAEIILQEKDPLPHHRQGVPVHHDNRS